LPLTDISKILLPDSHKKCYTKDKQNIRYHKRGLAMKNKGFIVLCLILFLASDIFKLTALANSARRIWYGVDMTGTVVKGENCPIEVEDEQLTFDISEFPNSYYEKKGDFLKYNGKVTAKYTFYNPADYKVTAKLVFPFGYYPEYGPDEYDEKNQVYKRIDDTTKFDIKINDKEIKKTLRHTLAYRDNVFDIHNEMSMISDGFIKDDFYSPELAVTKYIYEIRGVDKELYKSATAAIEILPFDGKRIYYLEQSYCFTTDDKGRVRMGIVAENGKEVELYVIGEPTKEMPEWKFYESSSNESKEIKGEMQLKSTSKMTFKEFALTSYDKGGQILESDWYNIIVELYKQATVENSGAIFISVYDTGERLKSLLRWYEYEITLAPGEKITNTIEAPMYPTIDEEYDPDIYRYNYLLSPASTWAKFGNLNVDINTPFFMTENNQSGFTKTQKGYHFKSNGLPEGELRFSLSTVEKPERKSNIGTFYILGMLMFGLLQILPIIVGVVAVVVLVVVWVRRRF